MEKNDQYNFSIFKPRNLHGRKNRNVILTMLLIWAVAVFGFQFLLRGLEKPVPEKTLGLFESTWPKVISGEANLQEKQEFLLSLLLVNGKNMVKPEDKEVLANAISRISFMAIPDSLEPALFKGISELSALKSRLGSAKDQSYLEIMDSIRSGEKQLLGMLDPYSGFDNSSLESRILISSLRESYPSSFSDPAFASLPGIMQLYLTHNQSVLTDTKFIGFPFHYFYTAIFLLVLFVGLCIVYNILIERRLSKEGVVE